MVFWHCALLFEVEDNFGEQNYGSTFTVAILTNKSQSQYILV